MSVPSFQQLMLPTLQVLARHPAGLRVPELEDEVAALLELSRSDLARQLPSGSQTVFANRLNWARSYMARALLVESPRRGVVKGTERARALVEEGLREVDAAVLGRFPEFAAWRERERARGQAADAPQPGGPEESIATSCDALNAELARDLIDRVLALSPAAFEKLIVDLMVKAGYGGGRPDMGKALGRSGDGGVDGVIRQDPFGLDVVYIQAKRLAPEKGVPVREVRDFVGGLEGHRASKGVFVTTSFFPASATEFVGRVSRRVALIDGRELAELMIRHRVGVRLRASYDVNRIDEDYFAL